MMIKNRATSKFQVFTFNLFSFSSLFNVQIHLPDFPPEECVFICSLSFCQHKTVFYTIIFLCVLVTPDLKTKEWHLCFSSVSHIFFLFQWNKPDYITNNNKKRSTPRKGTKGLATTSTALIRITVKASRYSLVTIQTNLSSGSAHINNDRVFLSYAIWNHSQSIFPFISSSLWTLLLTHRFLWRLCSLWSG